MFIKNNTAKKTERRLRDILASLSEAQAAMLLEFAEFLAARQGLALDVTEEAAPATPQPADIPRPEKESVVKAVKRLAATYPMLDRSKMLNETSTLMTQHIMHGRETVEVIDELEIMFRRHYEKIYVKDEGEKGEG
jgi:hypothetical protein